MTDTKLLPTRVIVDRTVLVELLKWAGKLAEEFGSPVEEINRLADEVESGQRVELYARDWPSAGTSE